MFRYDDDMLVGRNLLRKIVQENRKLWPYLAIPIP